MITEWAVWTLVAFVILGGCGMCVFRFVTWGCKFFTGKDRWFGGRAIAGVWICAAPLAVSMPGLYLHSSFWALGLGLIFGPFIWAFGFIIPILYIQGLLPLPLWKNESPGGYR